MATATITDKINNVVALLIDQCNCGGPGSAPRPPVQRRSTIVCELHLSSRKLVETTPGHRQGRMASGRTCPRVGFIVRNMARPAENVVAFYNKRGTCEQ